ncbi:telomere zinc finger-associated protein-like [Malaya genurostris]|uniref:telomere zinc finger-associated protein-like n=1 Tax=Malaya genurostris TaxID=325434 RepID=UPI0026F3DD9E|nr:telomere zinc finger-associated protein-like [Malaya genurostris]
MSNYVKIVLIPLEDFPYAICGVCIAQLNEIHEFQQTVMRNHIAVKDYRRTYGDEIIYPKLEEDDVILIDVYDLDPRLTEIKEEEYFIQDDVPEIVSGQTVEIVKDVGVYHMDGELKTVVVKQENLSPEHEVTTVTNEKVCNENKKAIPSKPSTVMPHINILNRRAITSTVPKRPPPEITSNLKVMVQEKRIKVSVLNASAVVKCSQCDAVFQTQKNLAVHESTDHRKSNTDVMKPSMHASTSSLPTKLNSQVIQNRRTQRMELFKCNQCNSSFIQKANYEKHVKSCQSSVLSKLNTSQITIKRTTTVNPNHRKPQVTQLNQTSHSKKCDELENRIRCPQCPLTYKIKHFLNKHLKDVHKVPDNKEVHYCSICRLYYSCNEYLQLHIRAIHRFHCRQCNGDFRKCMHAQSHVQANLIRVSNKERMK